VADTGYSSANWSGIGVTGSSPNYFKANGSYVVDVFSVPAINTSVENCSYGPYYATIWAGFDGYGYGNGAYDVLQAGVDAIACGTASYQVWFEWWTWGCDPNTQPTCGENVIPNFPVHQGDTIVVVVTYYSASPNGNAFIADYGTGQYTSVWFNQATSPICNCPYSGDTAEWIVERSGHGSPIVYYDLADYGYFYMEGTYNGILPGSGPASGPDYFTMICMTQYPWIPSNACANGTTLSYVSSYNPTAGQIVFTPTGPTIQWNQ
jgi:hypothetical protein